MASITSAHVPPAEANTVLLCAQEEEGSVLEVLEDKVREFSHQAWKLISPIETGRGKAAGGNVSREQMELKEQQMCN